MSLFRIKFAGSWVSALLPLASTNLVSSFACQCGNQMIQIEYVMTTIELIWVQRDEFHPRSVNDLLHDNWLLGYKESLQARPD
jgi:hypothetical protein